ncbi:glycosyltransferase [Alcanivorax sp.]|uniref:glycosyltransferase n=1 Tax=Alcanivorax sp. TaxID=1872427 RepID=UPI0025C0AC9E|nr:glycosyltransferase [Alcanivorax sp.]
MQSKLSFSVLMSLYGKENPLFFREAFRSIYEEQTRKPDEIVLVLDGPIPTDLQTEVEKVRHTAGPILTIVELPTNNGLATALNTGMKHCTHEWIFRMDTDDIALPNRFQVQTQYLENHPHIDVLGALMEEFDSSNTNYSVMRHIPENHKDIVKFAKSRNPINHPVCCFKKSIAKEAGGYPLVYPEDYLLWIKLIQAGRSFHNLQTPLLRMRTGEAFIKRRGIDMLKGELRTYRYMLEIGFINRKEYLVTSALRSVVRLVPGWLKVIAYRYLR